MVNQSGFYCSKRWRGGSGISWTICKSFAPLSRQTTMPVPHHSVSTGRMPFLPPNQQRQARKWVPVKLSNIPTYSFFPFVCTSFADPEIWNSLPPALPMCTAAPTLSVFISRLNISSGPYNPLSAYLLLFVKLGKNSAFGVLVLNILRIHRLTQIQVLSVQSDGQLDDHLMH